MCVSQAAVAGVAYGMPQGVHELYYRHFELSNMLVEFVINLQVLFVLVKNIGGAYSTAI